MTAPDYADRIAARIFEVYPHLSSIFLLRSERRIIERLLSEAARAGYELRDGVGK